MVSATNSFTNMPKKISDLATARVPALASRISLFSNKLQISRYAAGSITDYCHALYKAVYLVGKLPEEFTQQDIDGYLKSMLDRRPQPAQSQFKHFIYGFKCYLNTLGYPELAGLVMPKVRREKTLPTIMSTQEIARLLRGCQLYSKALLSVIYDCGLRAFEACNLKWNDISFDRCQMHIKKGKGGKDRVVPISYKTLQVLKVYRRNYPSMNYVFKRFGQDRQITTAFIRSRLREALRCAGLNDSLTTHSLRHSYCTHLLEAGEDIQTAQQRMGHSSVQSTMIYLHLAKIEKNKCIRLIDTIFQ